MSGHPAYIISCDGRCEVDYVSMMTSPEQVRATLAEQGWRVDAPGRPGDYCPTCSQATVLRSGNEVLVCHGERVVASFAIPADASSSQVEELLDGYRAAATASRNIDALEYLDVAGRELAIELIVSERNG